MQRSRSGCTGEVTFGVGLEKWEDRVRSLWETGLEPFGGHLSQTRRQSGQKGEWVASLTYFWRVEAVFLPVKSPGVCG